MVEKKIESMKLKPMFMNDGTYDFDSVLEQSVLENPDATSDELVAILEDAQLKSAISRHPD